MSDADTGAGNKEIQFMMENVAMSDFAYECDEWVIAYTIGVLTNVATGALFGISLSLP